MFSQRNFIRRRQRESVRHRFRVNILNNLVNDLGLDASSTGTIIGWAIELYQRGLINDSMTGAPLQWGDYETVHALIEDIAYRRGFGDKLAESSQAGRFFPTRSPRLFDRCKKFTAVRPA